VNSRVVAALVAALVLAGCAGHETEGQPTGPKSVADNDLANLLLAGKDVDAIMGTAGMTPQGAVVTTMTDNRNLLPNLNCLGVWQVAQTSIYEPSHFKALRQQLLRVPHSDQWEYQVVESVVSYATPDGAHAFFDESAQRWGRCTNHHVNITLNNGKLPPFLSGQLTTTDDRLSMPYTRGADASLRTCQHVLGVAANVVIDVQACKPAQPEPISSAMAVVDEIESRMAR
jgi:serine/threonine-protein kinase